MMAHDVLFVRLFFPWDVKNIDKKNFTQTKNLGFPKVPRGHTSHMTYLFDHLCAFLALTKPGFFLSLILASLLRRPYGFNVILKSLFHEIRDLAIPNLIASAAPANHPQEREI
jgi:hypothetical protein